ncbi:MAG: ATP-binding protein [Pseudomonadota bacterium]
MEFISIRKRLQFIVVGATLTALLFSLAGNIVGDIWIYHRDVGHRLEHKAAQLAESAAPALRDHDRDMMASRIWDLRADTHVIAVFDAQGKLLSGYAAPESQAGIPVGPGPSGERQVGRELLLARPVIEGAHLIGFVYLSCDYDLAQTIFADIEIAIGIMVLAMLIALWMIRRLEHRVTGPIIAVSATARAVVAEQDYSRRVVRSSHDEVGILVDAFNEMLRVVQSRTLLLESSNADLEREAGERLRAQLEIMRLNEALELRVRERTVQLEESNHDLEQARAVAEHANHAKSAFLSSMSHELRTPLNSILGFAQLLASDAQAQELRKEFAGYIMKAGSHLLTLINEILDLSKIESGAVMLSLEAVPLAAVMQDCLSMIGPLAAQRGIRLAFPANPPWHVCADQTRLKQVMLNLLSNAVKYNRVGGSVAVQCQLEQGGRLRIGVLDNGPGLAPEQLAKLFQSFNRLGQEDGDQEGTGIGLVVTKRLVELMGGSIEVSCAPGAGCAFWVDLAVVAAPLPLAAPAVPPLVAGHTSAAPATLLYIEDNPVNLMLVEAIIRLEPAYRLLSAPDAGLGIALARAHQPQLILMDLNLPGMSGTDALAILRADPLTAAIPVVAVVASAMPFDRTPDAAPGFFRYLNKPIDVEQFQQTIRDALHAHSLLRARQHHEKKELV